MPKLKDNLIPLTITLLITLLFIVITLSVNNFYNNIFRLSKDTVTNSLNKQTSQCSNIIDCQLLPGDILIRRYITQKTRLVDKVLHPYFTHSAFYLGQGQIIEAIGQEKTHADEIRITNLTNTDWIDSTMESWVIIRPKKITPSSLEIINNNFQIIANDPDYRFGIPKNNNKKTTCADLIYQQLIKQNIIKDSVPPKYITPDYLYWLAINKPNDFEIIARNIIK